MDGAVVLTRKTRSMVDVSLPSRLGIACLCSFLTASSPLAMLLFPAVSRTLRTTDIWFTVATLLPPIVGGLILNSHRLRDASLVGLCGYAGVILVRMADAELGLGSATGAEFYFYLIYVVGFPIGVSVYIFVTFLFGRLRLPWGKKPQVT